MDWNKVGIHRYKDSSSAKKKNISLLFKFETFQSFSPLTSLAKI